VFIPLGGSRGGSWRTARNLVVSMMLGGLWHGANWNYVVWGPAAGLLLIGQRTGPLFASVREELSHCCGSARDGRAHRVYVLLFLPDVLVVFRCVGLRDSGTMLWAGCSEPSRPGGRRLHSRAVWMYRWRLMVVAHPALCPGWRRWTWTSRPGSVGAGATTTALTHGLDA